MTVKYVFEPETRAAIPVVGTDALFPVHRIYCIGRNYAAHAREMGHDPDRDPPFFFLKAPDAVQPVAEGVVTNHPYPPKTANYHHEIELVVALHRGGRDIAVSDALSHVFGYAVGLDMTRRDLQDEAKNLRRPWDVSKSADLSAPMGPLHPASAIGHPSQGPVSLAVNGAPRQTGDLNDMIWSVAEQIAILSQHFELKPGDLIFTGTPEGVGAVGRGDQLEATITGVGTIALTIV
jgi:fumarylpyruvate hydrolase